MSDGRHLVARLSRGDVNMPRYDGSTMDFLLQELQFEVDACALVQRVPAIIASRIVDYRAPVQSAAPRFDMPKDIAGRRLMIFEKGEGEHNVWRNLSPDAKVHEPVLFPFCFPPVFWSSLVFVSSVLRPPCFLRQLESAGPCSPSIYQPILQRPGSSRESSTLCPRSFPSRSLLRASFGLQCLPLGLTLLLVRRAI